MGLGFVLVFFFLDWTNTDINLLANWPVMRKSLKLDLVFTDLGAWQTKWQFWNQEQKYCYQPGGKNVSETIFHRSLARNYLKLSGLTSLLKRKTHTSSKSIRYNLQGHYKHTPMYRQRYHGFLTSCQNIQRRAWITIFTSSQQRATDDF